MSDYMKNQGLVDAATGSRNRQRELEAEIKELRECELDLLKRLDKAEDEIERLQAVVDAAKDAWFKSGAFDNYECYFGAKLGKCPQSNDCWECQLHQALATLEDNDE